MGKKSRDKGYRGEAEIVRLLQSEGYDARRGNQYHRHGAEDNPDVLALPGIHIEVKRTESFRLWDALAQAKADCGSRIPTVWHRRNNCPWVVVIDAHDFMTIYRSWEAENNKEV